MIKKNRLIGGIICFLLCIQGSPASGADVLTIKREERPEMQEIIYTVDDGQGMISVTVYLSEINQGLLHLRSESSATISEQSWLFGQVLIKVFKEWPISNFTTMFIGRLDQFYGPENTVLSSRLVKIAYDSELWNATNGAPATGHANQTVFRLIQQSSIFSELNDVFHSFKSELVISGVEKVLVSRPDREKDRKMLETLNIPVTARLPFDGLIWFKIIPVS